MIATYLFLLLYLPLFGNCAAVTTVTLLGVLPTSTTTADLNTVFSNIPTPTPIYSAIGVGSDGLTTYIAAIEYSREYEIQPVVTGTTTLANGDTENLFSDVTTTSTFPVQTQLATLVEGASQLKYVQEITTLVSLGTENDCHWDENGKGECEQKVWDPSDSASSTFTTTFTGTVHPFYTLVVSSAIPGQPSATSNSYGVRQALVGVSTTVMIISSAAFFVLPGFI